MPGQPTESALPTRPLDTQTQRCQPSPVRFDPTHLLSPWTLGLCGANLRPVRSAPAHLPSAWTVGLAGARPARWGGLVLRGGTTPVASSAAGPAFGPLLCGSATGVVGAPRKTSSPHRACRIAADLRRCCRQATRRLPEPKAEARIPCPAPPATADVKINLIESPQIHSLPRSTDKPGAPNNALWTAEAVVDNQPPQPAAYKIICRKSPRYTAYRRAPTKRQHRSGPCGQPEPLWTADPRTTDQRTADQRTTDPRTADQWTADPL
ncbi:hypothetical protein LV75_006198 [Actinokineospora diospyrosa]|uniref:Uncharacterized protein n=1 Tax=Actinokineospora diospyrosa TaxID=103728 RepID=A0ABT1ILY8_9PSEU|nr:hypothetical protein [Actinokineospora diospyrosa]